MLLFFDTETTGFPEDDAHVIQLGAILAEMDGRERATLNVMLDWGVLVPSPARAVHGLSADLVARCGVEPVPALLTFAEMVAKAARLVAHNTEFDAPMMMLALNMCGLLRAAGTVRAKPKLCTMTVAAPVLDLPPSERMMAAGIAGPKKPRLAEAYSYFTGRALEGAHDALADARACKEIYFRMRAQGIIEDD